MHTRMCFVAAPTLAWTGRKLTFQRRLLTLCAWLMVFPNCGPLPQISQTRAINSEVLPGLLPKPIAESTILQESAGFRQAAQVEVPVWGRAPSPVQAERKLGSSRTVAATLYAAFPATTCVQKLHRRASIGISLEHSGHFFVVGSAGAGAFRVRAMSALIGVTTKK